MRIQNITPDEVKIIILIAGVFIAGLVILHKRDAGENIPYVKVRDEAESFESRRESSVVVDVSGAVWRPGVYTLPGGARVGDALDKAMLRPDADIDRVNRARVLYDGQKLVVPAAAPSSRGAVPGQEETYININSATAGELEALPSIGESRARDIVDYRERRGPFSSVDELANIPGIGEATVERLRERVVVR